MPTPASPAFAPPTPLPAIIRGMTVAPGVRRQPGGLGRPTSWLVGLLLGVGGHRLPAAPLELPRIFADGMVLQRDAELPLQGRAGSLAPVTVRLGDVTIMVTADAEGGWTATLPPQPPRGEGMTLVVTSGAESIVCRDVLVGDVWFAGGQSNMAYTAGEMAERLPAGRLLVDAADLPGIRLRRITEPDAAMPQADLSARVAWDACTPATVRGHSAVAFVFARRLHLELGVPIGVIDCSWGGTPIEPYVPVEAFTGHPTLERLAACAAAGDVDAIRRLPGGTFVRGPSWLPGAIFNGRIAPVVAYRIRGGIWYQGESNCGRGEDPRDYAWKMRALVRGWRHAWRDDELPMFFVQLPQWDSPGWPWLREEQRRATDVAGTGMAITIDLDNAGDIHPPNKLDVGERLARFPLARLHGRDVVTCGPEFRAATVAGASVRVTFDHAADGLVADTRPPDDADPQLVHGFDLAAADGRWHPAEARIDDDSVVVFSPAVPAPVAVRYACRPQADPQAPWTLRNTAGLPAGPFCSDWSLMPYDPAANPP